MLWRAALTNIWNECTLHSSGQAWDFFLTWEGKKLWKYKMQKSWWHKLTLPQFNSSLWWIIFIPGKFKVYLQTSTNNFFWGIMANNWNYGKVHLRLVTEMTSQQIAPLCLLYLYITISWVGRSTQETSKPNIWHWQKTKTMTRRIEGQWPQPWAGHCSASKRNAARHFCNV